MSFVLPRYGTGSLADVMPSVLAVLGVPDATDRLGLKSTLDGVGRVAVLLVDGFGYHQLRPARPYAPALDGFADVRVLTAPFPSTTPASLASLGTGAVPGAHGIIGFNLRIPGGNRILNHVKWGAEPDPLLWQPLPTQFELARAAGVDTTVVTRPEFNGSGLTRAAYRGGTFRGAAGAVEVADEMLAALHASTTKTLVYGYHADLDKAGHLFGVDSGQWRDAVSEVDILLTRLLEGLPPDTALLVTADHGQIDIPAAHRFDCDLDDRLASGIHLVAGEARVRYLHTEPGATADVLAAWRDVLGETAWVVERDEAVAVGWFGPVADEHLARVGDVVVVCRDDYAVVASTRSPTEALLVAYHGSATAAEMEIPLLIVRT